VREVLSASLQSATSFRSARFRVRMANASLFGVVDPFSGLARRSAGSDNASE